PEGGDAGDDHREDRDREAGDPGPQERAERAIAAPFPAAPAALHQERGEEGGAGHHQGDQQGNAAPARRDVAEEARGGGDGVRAEAGQRHQLEGDAQHTQDPSEARATRSTG
ncbi:hypothetical protein DTX79_07880, partial [Bacilli bacterium]